LANSGFVESRLIVKTVHGEYIVLPASGHATINAAEKKLGLNLPRMTLPPDVEPREGDQGPML
jgi:hypothetical protein